MALLLTPTACCSISCSKQVALIAMSSGNTKW
jgi:hypothetical protein